MAQYPYDQLGTPLDTENLAKANGNWAKIEADIKSADSSSQLRDNAMTSEYRAKFLEQKNEYTGRLDLQNDRIDNIVSEVSGEAFNLVVDSAKIFWLAPVNTFSDLTVVYPNAVEGETSMVRDTGVVYRYDGNSWNEIQEIDPTAINEVDTRLNEDIKEMAINVKTLGATLDGVVDCTQYLIDAHDALPSRGGRILIPVGVMKVSSPVTFTKTVVLEGASVAHLVGTTGSVILMTGTGTINFTGSSSGARDIFIDGDASNTGNGITMLNNRPWLENVTVVNQGAHGVQIGSTTDTAVNVNSGHISNLRVKANDGDGLKIIHANASSPDANAITVLNIDCGYNGGNGITLVNCFDNQFVGVHSEGNTGYGIQLINAGSHVFLKPYCEFNTLGEFKADSNSLYNYVYGHRRDSNFVSYVFDNTNNFVQGRSSSKSIFPMANRQGAEILTVSKEGISGYWDIEEDGANRDFKVTLKGTSASAYVKFLSGSTGVVTLAPERMQVGGGTVITKHLTAGATLNFGTLPAQTQSEKTITVTGAALYDSVTVVPNAPPTAGVTWSCFVSAADTVTVRMSNVTTASVVVSSIGWKAFVTKHA